MNLNNKRDTVLFAIAMLLISVTINILAGVFLFALIDLMFDFVNVVNEPVVWLKWTATGIGAATVCFVALCYQAYKSTK